MTISGLIHRARVVGQARTGTRNEQGEMEEVPDTGPWILARVMERGGVAPGSRRSQFSTAERVSQGFEMLLDTVDDETGADVDVPVAGSTWETDCPVLGSPTLTLSGDGDTLNNGSELIAYDCYATVPKDRA